MKLEALELLEQISTEWCILDANILINEAIKELEERQKEDEYIYQKMKESLSMGNKAQSLSFVEVYQIINKRLSK